MARRTLIWHLGLADAARAVVPAGLQHHTEALHDLGAVVVADRREAELATHDLLRSHDDVGLRRRDVEGRWARLADRVWAHKGVSLLSTPGLGAADKEQLRLALDPLIGVEVHLVLTVDHLADQLYGAWVAELLRGSRSGARKHARRVELPLLEPGAGTTASTRFWAGHELGSLLARWGWTMHADRLHVVPGDAQAQWSGLLEVAGLDGGALPPVLPAYVDPASAALLREVNRRVDAPLPYAARAALLEEWAPDHPDATPATPHQVRGYAALLDHWAVTAAKAGHDVRGDLRQVLERPGPAVPAPGPRVRWEVAAQALADALGEQAELRERADRLEREVEALDRKRRTWKRRAKEQQPLAAVS